ncbi:MAG TPA: 16S rRNA (cytosine(1402)-N(4))-methyltransferase RsmH [Victivallales bacterium]|nr:16S rRNA (cytosine(1402)-N(4))-methyltransferase RsmH [Victivallales bacterium]
MSESENYKHHIPVMAQEVLDYLIVSSKNQKIIDGTLGFGGHSKLMISKNSKAELLGIDRDDTAIKYSTDLLSFAKERVTIAKGKFSDLAEISESIGWNKVDSILLDIGVSSLQIDKGERGFSFRENGPLDMRMDSRQKKTASQILNFSHVEDLAKIFREYGEIKQAWKLANAIVERRTDKPWFYTQELAELCQKVLTLTRKNGPPAPTLCFQALRIAVNDELGELEKAVRTSIEILNKGGRLCVISYHSLEDRIVKNIFKNEATECICPPGLPICKCDHKASIKLITKKPLTPTSEEVKKNRRAASAKMRIAEKI